MGIWRCILSLSGLLPLTLAATNMGTLLLWLVAIETAESIMAAQTGMVCESLESWQGLGPGRTTDPHFVEQGWHFFSSTS